MFCSLTIYFSTPLVRSHIYVNRNEACLSVFLAVGSLIFNYIHIAVRFGIGYFSKRYLNIYVTLFLMRKRSDTT